MVVLKFMPTWVCCIFMDFSTNIIWVFYLEILFLFFVVSEEFVLLKLIKTKPKYIGFLLTVEVLGLLYSESNRWYFRGQKDLLPVQKLDLSTTLT